LLTTLVVSVTVLIIILASDLGRRAVTTMRLIRPLIAVGIVIAIFFRSLPTGGNDLALQLAGVGAGAILGLIAGSMLRAERDPSGAVYTVSGWGYAVFWIVISALRVLFVYGAEHWFPAAIIEFCINYRISGPEVFANALVFLALAMVLARTAVVLRGSRRLRKQAAGAELAAGTGMGR
jgi:hypothetical protein